MTTLSTLVPQISAQSVLAAVAVAWAAVAAIWDLRTRRIPNWMTFPGALLGLVLNLALGGAGGLGRSALGILAGLVLLIVPFAMGGMGAGDVKMLATVGAFGGPAFAFRAFLYGSIAGGLIAVGAILARSRALSKSSVAVVLSTGRLPGGVVKASKQAFPYGIAILAGTIAACFLR